MKQFLLQKGERLGFGSRVVDHAAAHRPGHLVRVQQRRPGAAAEDIRGKAKTINDKILNSEPESRGPIDDLLLKPLKNEPVDVLEFVGATPNFIETGLEDNERSTSR